MRVFFAVLRKIEKTQDIESVVQRHNDDVAAARQIFAVKHQSVVAGSGSESASMKPDHHRALFVVVDPGRPDIDPQAVFTLDAVLPLEHKRLFIVQASCALVLGTDVAIVAGASNSGPWLRLFAQDKSGSLPRGCSVRNTLEGVDPPDNGAGDFAGLDFHNRGSCPAR